MQQPPQLQRSAQHPQMMQQPQQTQYQQRTMQSQSQAQGGGVQSHSQQAHAQLAQMARQQQVASNIQHAKNFVAHGFPPTNSVSAPGYNQIRQQPSQSYPMMNLQGHGSNQGNVRASQGGAPNQPGINMQQFQGNQIPLQRNGQGINPNANRAAYPDASGMNPNARPVAPNNLV